MSQNQWNDAIHRGLIPSSDDRFSFSVSAAVLRFPKGIIAWLRGSQAIISPSRITLNSAGKSERITHHTHLQMLKWDGELGSFPHHLDCCRIDTCNLWLSYDFQIVASGKWYREKKRNSLPRLWSWILSPSNFSSIQNVFPDIASTTCCKFRLLKLANCGW